MCKLRDKFDIYSPCQHGCIIHCCNSCFLLLMTMMMFYSNISIRFDRLLLLLMDADKEERSRMTWCRFDNRSTWWYVVWYMCIIFFNFGWWRVCFCFFIHFMSPRNLRAAVIVMQSNINICIWRCNNTESHFNCSNSFSCIVVLFSVPIYIVSW